MDNKLQQAPQRDASRGRVAPDIEQRFARLCTEVGRRGVIGFAPVEGVRLLPQQSQRLQDKLAAFASAPELTAISFGLFYREPEILAVPSAWQVKKTEQDPWNDYARAYQELNRTLDHVSSVLAAELGGVAEKATIEGWAGTVQNVGDYFPHCVSHRAFAEAAGLGWRGRHGLIVTPEVGPALRFATVFVPGRLSSLESRRDAPQEGVVTVATSPESRRDAVATSPPRKLAGCGDCRACLDVCPILGQVYPAKEEGRQGLPLIPPLWGASTRDYREACRRRIHALGLVADVCGICVRACWGQVIGHPHVSTT